MASDIKSTKDSKQRTDVDEALRNFAHEIRTPLNSMLGYTHLIADSLKEGKQPGKIAEYNDTVKTATTQLLKICERVLDEAVTGETILIRRSVDAAKIANDVVATFKALADERGVELICDFPADFPELNTDPLLLSQALSNLVSNAIKFTPKGGFVTVRGETCRETDALIFVVQDTGDGIPADLLLRLRSGEHFSTAHAHGHKGWGRGLMIADGLCSRIGAQLRFEHARTGGTVALITIPFE